MTKKKNIEPTKDGSRVKPAEAAVSDDSQARKVHIRRLRLPPAKLLRFKRIQHPVTLPGAFQIAKKAWQTFWSNRRLLLGLAIVYALLNILFVHGLTSTGNAQSVRQQFLKGLGGNSQVATDIASLSNLFADSTSSATAAAGVYEVVLGIIASLATIWALRQVLSGTKVRIRDTFYKGMTPLIPFFLVMLVVLIQCLPFLIGGAIYNIAVTYGIAITVSEKIAWGLLFVVLTCISIYMVCSSLFALYIVTLPDMTPLKALRSARQLVRYRRLSVLRKLLFLIMMLAVGIVVLAVPVLLIIPAVAQWEFFLIGIVSLIFIHTYMYTLYRELLV